MRPAKREIGTILLNSGGVIARRDHPELAEAMRWLVTTGDLRTVLPGIYAPPQLAGDVMTRIRAAMRWSPDAVLTGPAAASVSFWPQIRVPVVTLAVSRQRTLRAPGFELTRRAIPVDLIEGCDGVRFTTPALTALDLCDFYGGDGIDTALRTGAADLDGMRAAMAATKGRGGNKQRRQLLHDSRDEPWSAAERETHRLLHDGLITGWKGNVSLRIPKGECFVDVLFRVQMLALEIDGPVARRGHRRLRV